MKPVHIIGGGLAGCEAAWQIAQGGVPVILYEMRPLRMTEAHKSENLAELVCSNSFRSHDHLTSAIGLLHAEMLEAKSLIMTTGYACRIPAGSALAVDRDSFSQKITDKIASHPLITIKREEVKEIRQEQEPAIIATGPLTSLALSAWITGKTGEEALAFFDAIAPVLSFESVNMDVCWFQSRYDKAGPGGTGKDYINCPMTRDQYQDFVESLLEGTKTSTREWEKTPFFEGCLPIEVMAERGKETLRHGPMKPFGLTNPHPNQGKPYAVVQLRQDNTAGTLYNMVGFQTKLKYGEQIHIFRKIPGLEQASFVRLGGIHRNTYINSPLFLNHSLQLKGMPGLRFAGQITGCEGYVESAAIGLLAGRFACAEHKGMAPSPPPLETALGSLLHYITQGHFSSNKESSKRSFQPMNINFGLFPLLETEKQDGKLLRGKNRKLTNRETICKRALEHCRLWLSGSEESL